MLDLVAPEEAPPPSRYVLVPAPAPRFAPRCPRHGAVLIDVSAGGLPLVPGLCFRCVEQLECERWVQRLTALARHPPGTRLLPCHCAPCEARGALFPQLLSLPRRRRSLRRRRGHRRR